MSIEVFPLPPSGPSLAEITAAITSNAAPASVTMPAITSSITTNAASSGVTMAAITSAITTNAASSGVTMAAINTAVANNASPFGGTWANLGTYNTGGGNTVTFSNLSGYKYLRLYYSFAPSNALNTYMRFNGNSSNYFWGFNFNQQTSLYQFTAGTEFVLTSNTSSPSYGVIEIRGSNNTTAHKHVTRIAGATSSLDTGFAGVWADTSAITSMTLFTSSNTWNNVYMNLLGAN